MNNKINDSFISYFITYLLPKLGIRYNKNFSEKDKENIKNFFLKENFYNLFILRFTMDETLVELDPEEYNKYRIKKSILKQYIKLYLFFKKYFSKDEIIDFAFDEAQNPINTFNRIKILYKKYYKKTKM